MIDYITKKLEKEGMDSLSEYEIRELVAELADGVCGEDFDAN